MSRNEKLKNAYRNLQIQDTPDLWERISKNLTGAEAREDGDPGKIHETGKKRRKRYRFEAGIAAAACCVIVALGSLTARRLGNPGRSGPEMEGAFLQQETAGPAKDVFEKEGGIVYYENLPLGGAHVQAPAKNTVCTAMDFYFTEEVLKDTSLMVKAAVSKVFYDEESDGRIHNAIYEIEIDKVLYAENHISAGQKIRVKSPLIEGGDARKPLYGLKEGGTYVLPLKYEDGSYRPVFPYAPQIEVTAESGYVYHNGWHSLVDHRSSVVLMTSQTPGDFYYDRMMLREDPDFLTELIQLVKQERKYGRKT